jgi:guanylate kinase
MLFVVCAPSGAGKTTILKEIFKFFPFLSFSVSATTRKIRGGEQNEKDYYFISKEDFDNKIKRNEFIEWEVVFGEYYGTLKVEVEKYLTNKHDIVFDVDVKGALSIKQLYPEAITIFIYAPKNEIVERLKRRKTESAEELGKRIKRMELELGLLDQFDYAIVNESKPGGLENAVNDLKKIITNYINKKK